MAEDNVKDKLVLPQEIYNRIMDIVASTPRGLETGVTLFGLSVGDKATHVVLAVAGPGKKATHESGHYSGDEEHANAMYETLHRAMPQIRWLGELHVHPKGMTWLSRGDRRTVKQILTGTDETLHPEEFIAGVMQRHRDSVDIYPVHFTRTCLDGKSLKVCVVDTHALVVEDARRKGAEK